MAQQSGVGIFGWLIFFAVIGGIAIAYGLLFGVFHTIATQLNSANITIDQNMLNTIDTAGDFANIGLLIGLAIGVIGLAMLLIRVIGSMGGEA